MFSFSSRSGLFFIEQSKVFLLGRALISSFFCFGERYDTQHERAQLLFLFF
jgi:hypothetical protein